MDRYSCFSEPASARQHPMLAHNGWYKRDPCVARESFQSDRFYLLDGGFGTTVAAYVDDPVEVEKDPLWAAGMTRTRPDFVQRCHKDFLAAGATIIETNTYQATTEGFIKYLGVGEVDAARMYGMALELADKAVEEHFGVPGAAIVACSSGPYGASLADGSEYSHGHVHEMGAARLEAWHEERIHRLADAGADFFAIETIPSVIEAEAVLNALLKRPGLRCWLSFQCRDEGHTAAGEPFALAVRRLMEHKAYPEHLVAVGVNCVKPYHVEGLLREANTVNCASAWPRGQHRFVRLPYVVYPNSGEDWDGENECWKEDATEEESFLAMIPTWMKLGANVIGGCCRILPERAAKMRQRMKASAEEAFRYRRQHFKEAKMTLRQQAEALAKLEASTRPKGEVLIPSDLIGQASLMPGAISKEKAAADFRAMCEHFGVDVPQKEPARKDDDDVNE